MSLATSKPETPATLMLSHFGLLDSFDVVTGASDDEVRSSKEDVVAEALRRLVALGADVSNTVHVGDRKHDVEGAAANGVPTIFSDWGYRLGRGAGRKPRGGAQPGRATLAASRPLATSRCLVGSAV